MKLLSTIFACLFSLSIFAAEPIKNSIPEIGSISRMEVYWIYTLKTRFWDDGRKITVFYLDFNNPVHVQFVRENLGTSPQQFQDSVNAYVNVGNAAYFRKVESETDMVRAVSRTTGSVGYIAKDVILINGGYNDVKKIRIID